jgi:hypothetical protein
VPAELLGGANPDDDDDIGWDGGAAPEVELLNCVAADGSVKDEGLN